MATTEQRPKSPAVSDATTTSESDPRLAKIDPTAPAGSKNSLGEESVRDGRPTTDDSTVEAIDEETPATPGLPDR
jgi:hypothetical protein